MQRRFRKNATIAVLLTVGVAASVVLAGPKDYRCPADAQTCLDRMVSKLKDRAWLGIEYDELRLTRVVPGSPASAAGFEVGDVLVSINGVKFADNDEDRCLTCEKTRDVWKPGSTVEYVVLRGEEEVRLTPTLAEMPPDILAMMVGLHMIEHAEIECE